MSLKWGEVLNSSTFYLSLGLLQFLGQPSPSRDRDDERFPPKHRWASPGSWHLSLPQLGAWAHLRISPGCVKLFSAVYLQTNGVSLINYQPLRAAAEEFSVSPTWLQPPLRWLWVVCQTDGIKEKQFASLLRWQGKQEENCSVDSLGLLQPGNLRSRVPDKH